MNKLSAWSLAIVLGSVFPALAQNTVTFSNQSDEPALVRLIGPTSREVEVPNGARRTVDAAAGSYMIKVRYGVSGKYRYSKGEEFDVVQTQTTRSHTTITLHKVLGGNYDSYPISENEFTEGQAASEPEKTAPAPSEAEKVEPAIPKEKQSIFCFIPKAGDHYANVKRVDQQFDNLHGPTFKYSGGPILAQASKEMGREVFVKMRGAYGHQISVPAIGAVFAVSIFKVVAQFGCVLDRERVGTNYVAELTARLSGVDRPFLLDAKGKRFVASADYPGKSLDALDYTFGIQGEYQAPLRLVLPWGRLVLLQVEDSLSPGEKKADDRGTRDKKAEQ